jgi:transcriptional regulator with XRE-family HTH domain
MVLGQRLKENRKDAGWSQGELLEDEGTSLLHMPGALAGERG